MHMSKMIPMSYRHFILIIYLINFIYQKIYFNKDIFVYNNGRPLRHSNWDEVQIRNRNIFFKFHSDKHLSWALH